MSRNALLSRKAVLACVCMLVAGVPARGRLGCVRDDAEGVRVRRAETADADFIAGLLAHDEVEPFLSARRPRGQEELLELIKRSQREPQSYGVFVIEVGGERVGVMEFETANERSPWLRATSSSGSCSR